MGRIAPLIRGGNRLIHGVIAGGFRVSQRVGGSYYIAVGIVGIGSGIAVAIGIASDPAHGVIRISNCMTVRVCAANDISIRIIGIPGMALQSVQRFNEVVLDIVGVDGGIAIPVRLPGNEAVPVVRVGLGVAQRVSFRHQLTGIRIAIGISIPKRGDPGSHPAGAVIFIGCRVAQGICGRNHQACSVAGVSRFIAQSIQAAGQVPAGVIGIGEAAAVGVCGRNQHTVLVEVAQGGIIPLNQMGYISVFIIGIADTGAVRVSDLRLAIGAANIFVGRHIALTVSLCGHPVVIIVSVGDGAGIVCSRYRPAILVQLDAVMQTFLRHIAVDHGAVVIGVRDFTQILLILMSHTMLAVVLILQNQISIVVYNLGQVMAPVVGVIDGISIRVGEGNQVAAAVIGVGDRAAGAVGHRGDVAPGIAKGKSSTGIADRVKAVAGICNIGGLAFGIDQFRYPARRVKNELISGFVCQQVTAVSAIQGIRVARIHLVATVSGQLEIQSPTGRKG